MMRDPLVVPFVMVALGVLLGTAIDFESREAVWPALAFAILAIPARRTRQPAAFLALLSTGLLSQSWHKLGSAPELDAGRREIVLVEGCVVEPTVFSPDRGQFTLEIAPGARARVSLPLDDNSPAPQRLEYGQRVEVEARFRTPHNYNNPGGFDYAGYL